MLVSGFAGQPFSDLHLYISQCLSPGTEQGKKENQIISVITASQDVSQKEELEKPRMLVSSR